MIATDQELTTDQQFELAWALVFRSMQLRDNTPDTARRRAAVAELVAAAPEYTRALYAQAIEDRSGLTGLMHAAKMLLIAVADEYPADYNVPIELHRTVAWLQTEPARITGPDLGCGE